MIQRDARTVPSQSVIPMQITSKVNATRVEVLSHKIQCTRVDQKRACPGSTPMASRGASGVVDDDDTKNVALSKGKSVGPKDNSVAWFRGKDDEGKKASVDRIHAQLHRRSDRTVTDLVTIGSNECPYCRCVMVVSFRNL